MLIIKTSAPLVSLPSHWMPRWIIAILYRFDGSHEAFDNKRIWKVTRGQEVIIKSSHFDVKEEKGRVFLFKKNFFNSFPSIFHQYYSCLHVIWPRFWTHFFPVWFPLLKHWTEFDGYAPTFSASFTCHVFYWLIFLLSPKCGEPFWNPMTKCELFWFRMIINFV